MNRLFYLLNRYSYKEGTFTLVSGKQSDFYIDCKQMFLQYEGLAAAARELCHALEEFDIQAVAGEGVGGAPLATAVSMYSGYFGKAALDTVIVRKAPKDHGTAQRVERAREAVPDGSKVALLEDVLTTGGSALRAVQALREANLDVVVVLALVDRLEGAKEAAKETGVELRSLYTRDDFIRNSFVANNPDGESS